jgi:hypothetical protein
LQGFLLQVEKSEIIVHEADEPNAFIDFLDSEALAGQRWLTLGFHRDTAARCLQALLEFLTAGDAKTPTKNP